MNPLLAADALADFGAVRAAHVTPAIDALLAEAESALGVAAGDETAAEFAALSKALDPPVERLQRVWSLIGHLHSVVDTPELRVAYHDNLPRIVDFTTRLGADPRLYAKMKAIAARADGALDPVQKKAVGDAVRDFVLDGAELDGVAKIRFAGIQARCAELSLRFGENFLDATDAWSLVVDEQALDGVPQDVRARARADAAALGVDGYRLSLQAPCRVPILRHATRRDLRESLYKAHAALCSASGAPAHDNSLLAQELLALRGEQARLLGHPSYADLSLVTKMARDPDEVTAFLRTLAARARPHAEAELECLRDFAARELGLETLEAWDRDFVAERLKQTRHGVDDEQLRVYFPLPHVLVGLQALLAELFQLSFHSSPVKGWHEDVQAFHVTRNGEPIGTLCLDLYARTGKQSGAWMDEARSRWRRPDDGALQLPVAHLVCNFAPPIDSRPCLLTHDQLVTLLHEFGHALHHLLTRIDEWSLAGISGVEWDAAELPSQFMENFCWDFDVLRRLSANVDDGRALPRELFERLLGARQFGAGLHLLRDIELALFDMQVHGQGARGRGIEHIVRSVRQEVSLFPDPLTLAYPYSFTHIFDGGYAAGYYGYAWAEVLASDAFSAFEATRAVRCRNRPALA